MVSGTHASEQQCCIEFTLSAPTGSDSRVARVAGEQCLHAQLREQVTSIPIGLVASVSLLSDMTGLSVVHCVRHVLSIVAVASSDGDTKLLLAR